MKKIVLMGRSECGKTTLTQALKGEKIQYHKTQYVNNFDVVIDTPGEYAQTKNLGYALALYSYEADVVGLLLSATEPYSLYPPCVTPVEGGDPERARRWLSLAGCKKIFYVNSTANEGIPELLEYLREEGDVMPWEQENQ